MDPGPHIIGISSRLLIKLLRQHDEKKYQALSQEDIIEMNKQDDEEEKGAEVKKGKGRRRTGITWLAPS